MKRIVVAVDGSEVSLRAVDMGVELAERFEATVVLAHVIPTAVIAGMEASLAALGELERLQRQEAERILSSAQARAARPQLTVERAVLEGGGIAELLVKLVDEREADLLVVGSHGRGAVSRVLLGSVTHRLLNLSKQPVLVVH